MLFSAILRRSATQIDQCHSGAVFRFVMINFYPVRRIGKAIEHIRGYVAGPPTDRLRGSIGLPQFQLSRDDFIPVHDIGGAEDVTPKWRPLLNDRETV